MLQTTFAYVGHRFFQKHRPGVLRSPLWAGIGNWVMTGDVLRGKLRW